MSDVMAVVDGKNWLDEVRQYDRELVPGDTLTDWQGYRTKNALVARYLETGDRLFLVTARKERLWLVVVYENVRLAKRSGPEYLW